MAWVAQSFGMSLPDGHDLDEYCISLYRQCKQGQEVDVSLVKQLMFDTEQVTHWTYRRWLWILKMSNLIHKDLFDEAMERIAILLDVNLLPIVLYSPDPTDWLGLIPLSPIPSLRILWQHVICLTWIEHFDSRFLLPADQLADLFVTDLDAYTLLQASLKQEP